MKTIYTTPNQEWIITLEDDGEWSKVFGIPIYTLRKFSEKKYKENQYRDKSDVSNYTLIHSVEKLESGFRWLRWIKAISSDEMKHQISIMEQKSD